MTEKNETRMSFEDALEYLKIPEFRDRIFYSNSHGELFHIMEYLTVAKTYKEHNATDEDLEGFREFFLGMVKYAEENWERPESVFQHLIPMMKGE